MFKRFNLLSKAATAKYGKLNTQPGDFLTWCSRFYRGSCHFLCSTMCRSHPAGPGSRSTWGIGCASSCPWCKGGNGPQFCPRSRRTASRTENLCPPVVAGCCLRDSPSYLRTHRRNHDRLLFRLFFFPFTLKDCFVHTRVKTYTAMSWHICHNWSVISYLNMLYLQLRSPISATRQPRVT